MAYQIFGEGEIDLVFFPGFVSNIETYWEEPLPLSAIGVTADKYERRS